MPDTLSYADAVRLLGGEKSKVVDWFDKLTGGVLLAASVPVPALLGIFDAKAEFVRLGHELMRGVSEKRSGLSRYGRTQRLEAAHAVIAVTAFFEALLDIELPFDVEELRLSKAEQVTMAGVTAYSDFVVDTLFAFAAPLPGPHVPYPVLCAELVNYYGSMTERLGLFLRGLVATAGVADTSVTVRALRELPAVAVDRHRELLTRLAVDFPEVSLWLGLHEHEATRGEVRRLSLGLADLRQILGEISTGRAPDERRAALAAAYAAELRQPVISSGDVPAGLIVPTLGEAYVPPLCRIARLSQNGRPGDETWWAEQPVRDDLWQALVVHLTGPSGTRAPLLVLGQPGSGKSVLTRVVAAQLPAADFLVVRVVLREVHAVGDLQDQIEQAIRNDTGERLDWPALARSAGDALPVVLLDGFDELLQATGVSQTDYLRRVAAFQRREADQGRPVAVLVTSRTSVADRAQPPPGTVAMRLEPFDETRVGAWVDTWNRVNAAAFGAPGERPLDPAVVLSHRELAEQPLLLLMLALYDAEGHDLRQAGELHRGDLYERLLRRFARREVTKHRAGLPDQDLDRAVEEELRRLAVVAFAMFNRGVQWVTSEELGADLAVLPFAGASAGRPDGLRVPLPAADVVLGRFFFIHRARAADGERRRETYEFLHATFGEFLVARLTAQAMDDLVAREAAASLPWGGEPATDDLLHALLSYAVLSTRVTVLAFLNDRLSGMGEVQRDAWTHVLLRLFRNAAYDTGRRRFDEYRPRRLRAVARQAAYSANLLLLILSAGGEVTGCQMFPEATVAVDEWRAQVGLWRSQLGTDEWDGLADLLALERLGEGAGRDVRIRLDSRFAVPPGPDLLWLGGMSTGGLRPGFRLPVETLVRLRRAAYLSCDRNEGLLVDAVEPIIDQLHTALTTYETWGNDEALSAARALLTAWLLPLRAASQAQRREVYLRCVRLAGEVVGLVDDWDRTAYLRLLLDRLAQDHEASPDVVADVLMNCRISLALDPWVATAMLQCVERVLGGDAAVDRRLASVISDVIAAQVASPQPLQQATVEAVARIRARGVVPVVPDLPDSLNARGRFDVLDRARRLEMLFGQLAAMPMKHRQDAVGGTPDAGS
ncbi:NACHT domain-containing NTPase [Micromonospora sp. RP3T]|uniref:NACHT domain-containing protein n=1 Tax=Micromonospora sp. RP3T TaxID=2135446 RepID=UPI001304D026|nr:AAA family ATPase [Micromonospora sp. RP3T]